MTLEQLLNCSASELEKMSDAELLEHFKPFLSVTRPELCVKPINKPMPKQQRHIAEQPQLPLSPQKKAALELLASEGVDLGFLNRRKK